MLLCRVLENNEFNTRNYSIVMRTHIHRRIHIEFSHGEPYEKTPTINMTLFWFFVNSQKNKITKGSIRDFLLCKCLKCYTSEYFIFYAIFVSFMLQRALAALPMCNGLKTTTTKNTSFFVLFKTSVPSTLYYSFKVHI
jgi:hypothetical protein